MSLCHRIPALWTPRVGCAQPDPGFGAPREQFGSSTTNAFHVGTQALCTLGLGFGKFGLSGTGLDWSAEICPWSLLVLLVLLGAYPKASGSLDASPANKPDWREDAVVFFLDGKSRSHLLSFFRGPCTSKPPSPAPRRYQEAVSWCRVSELSAVSTSSLAVLH